MIRHKVQCDCPGRSDLNLRRASVSILKKYTPVPKNPDEDCLDNIAKEFDELSIRTFHEGVLTGKEINGVLNFEFYRWFRTYLACTSNKARYAMVSKYNDYSFKKSFYD